MVRHKKNAAIRLFYIYLTTKTELRYKRGTSEGLSLYSRTITKDEEKVSYSIFEELLGTKLERQLN